MLDEHRPDVLLEEIVVLILGRGGQQGRSRLADARTEQTSQTELQVCAQHSWNCQRLWLLTRNNKTCRLCPLWYRRVREEQRGSQTSARAAVPSFPDSRGGRWPHTGQA